jgi:manganese/zinc/iron transport system substrate-binding protein
MVSDLVTKVGGEYVDNLCLIGPELDPHSYQLVKGDDEKLSFAHIVFFSGLGLEHGPSLHNYLASNEKAVALGDAIAKASPEAIIQIDGQTDPHIWLDISLWRQALPAIVQTLSDHDPAHAEVFRANAQKLYKHMDEAHQAVKKELASVPDNKRYLVTSHDAFNYFARAYMASPNELKSDAWMQRFQSPEGLAPDSQLSSKHIQEILTHLKKYRIRTIFPESNVSKDSLRKLVQAAEEQGMHIVIAEEPLYADAMGPNGSEAESYTGMLLHNARTLQQFMNGQPDQME